MLNPNELEPNVRSLSASPSPGGDAEGWSRTRDGSFSNERQFAPKIVKAQPSCARKEI
jgi:hypothetical protein